MVPVGKIGAFGHLVELAGKEFQVVVNERLELEDALGGEDVRDGLALAGVLHAIASVEETAAERNKAIIVVAIAVLDGGQRRRNGITYDFKKPVPWP